MTEFRHPGERNPQGDWCKMMRFIGMVTAKLSDPYKPPPDLVESEPELVFGALYGAYVDLRGHTPTATYAFLEASGVTDREEMMSELRRLFRRTVANKIKPPKDSSTVWSEIANAVERSGGLNEQNGTGPNQGLRDRILTLFEGGVIRGEVAQVLLFVSGQCEPTVPEDTVQQVLESVAPAILSRIDDVSKTDGLKYSESDGLIWWATILSRTDTFEGLIKGLIDDTSERDVTSARRRVNGCLLEALPLIFVRMGQRQRFKRPATL